MESSTLKQPAGLPVLFLAELWERFGFYCVQTLLVLYLTQKLGWADKPAYTLFSAFSALIYATPVIGGYLADKLLGYRRAIYIGTTLYLIGYFALASLNPHWFDFALAALICGNGFFKPNVSSLLGQLYHENDPRRDSGFTLFYMGINVGSFLAPIVCTYIAVNYGWHYGFLSAAIGMLICLVVCLTGFPYLKEHGLSPVHLSWPAKIAFYIGVLVVVYGFTLLMHQSQLVDDLLILIGVLAFVALIISAFFETPLQRNRLIVLVILMIFSILFWALFVQIFSSLILFTQRNVNREFFGYIIPTGMFTSTEPFFIILLSPIFALLWLRLKAAHSRFNPSTPMKFALALISIGCGYILLVIGIGLNKDTGLMGAGWLILNYLLLTIGELALSPIGLAAVTALAPQRLVGMVMGIWFLSLSAAYAVGGKLADLTAIPKNITDRMLMADIYQHNFLHFGLASIAIGLLLMLCTPKLRRMMAEE